MGRPPTEKIFEAFTVSRRRLPDAATEHISKILARTKATANRDFGDRRLAPAQQIARPRNAHALNPKFGTRDMGC